MINITQPGTAAPDVIRLTAPTTLSFRAESDEPTGEDATVIYSLVEKPGDPSDLVFQGNGTSISTVKHFPGGSAIVSHPVTLKWRDEALRRPMLVIVKIIVRPHNPDSLPDETTASLTVG
ncbi:MAG TPA: hypothetical protein VF263_13115 [Longimicrobiaceae bacterium]